MITVFQDFIGHSESKFAEMQKDVQKKGTIHYVVRVDAKIVPVTQVFTYNEVWGQCQNLYADHYSRNMLEAINKLLGTIEMPCIVQGYWSAPALKKRMELSKNGNKSFYKPLNEVQASTLYHLQITSSLQ